MELTLKQLVGPSDESQEPSQSHGQGPSARVWSGPKQPFKTHVYRRGLFKEKEMPLGARKISRT